MLSLIRNYFCAAPVGNLSFAEKKTALPTVKIPLQSAIDTLKKRSQQIREFIERQGVGRHLLGKVSLGALSLGVTAIVAYYVHDLFLKDSSFQSPGQPGSQPTQPGQQQSDVCPLNESFSLQQGEVCPIVQGSDTNATYGQMKTCPIIQPSDTNTAYAQVNTSKDSSESNFTIGNKGFPYLPLVRYGFVASLILTPLFALYKNKSSQIAEDLPGSLETQRAPVRPGSGETQRAPVRPGSGETQRAKKLRIREERKQAKELKREEEVERQLQETEAARQTRFNSLKDQVLSKHARETIQNEQRQWLAAHPEAPSNFLTDFAEKRQEIEVRKRYNEAFKRDLIGLEMAALRDSREKWFRDLQSRAVNLPYWNQPSSKALNPPDVRWSRPDRVIRTELQK